MSDLDQIINALNPRLDDIQKTQALLEQIEESSLQITNQQIEKFLSVIESTDNAALDLIIEELIKIQERNGTIQGALEKLADALSPDLQGKEDIVSYRQAIENIDRYGVIIPTNDQVRNANKILRQKKAFSLFFQSLIKFLILKFSRHFSKEVKDGSN